MADPLLNNPIAQANRILGNMHETLLESKASGKGTGWTKFRDRFESIVGISKKSFDKSGNENVLEERKGERNVSTLKALKAQVNELKELLESAPDRETALAIYDKISLMLREIEQTRHFFVYIYGERTEKENSLAKIGDIFSFNLYSIQNDRLNKPALVHLDDTTKKLKEIQKACDQRFFKIVGSEEEKVKGVIEGYRVAWITEKDQQDLTVELKSGPVTFQVSDVFLTDCLRRDVYFNHEKIEIPFNRDNPSDRDVQILYTTKLIQHFDELSFTPGQIQNFLHTATQRVPIASQGNLVVTLNEKYGGIKNQGTKEEYDLFLTTVHIREATDIFIHSSFNYEKEQYDTLSYSYVSRFNLFPMVSGNLMEEHHLGIARVAGVVDLLAPGAIAESEAGAFSQEAEAREEYSNLTDGSHQIEWKFFKTD